MKKLFKKQSIVDTAINVGIGGAANVAIDYVVSQIDALASVDPKYVHVGKILLGSFAGSMVSNKMLRAATDGVATVGVSNLINDLLTGDDEGTTTTQTTTGLAKGTVGRVIPGNRRYIRNGGTAGIGAAANAFMGK